MTPSTFNLAIEADSLPQPNPQKAHPMILYGISTCDTCKKALKTLAAGGREVTFRDVRADPLSAAEIDQIVIEFGERVINKQSTTYRGFSDFLKMSEPEAQLTAQP